MSYTLKRLLEYNSSPAPDFTMHPNQELVDELYLAKIRDAREMAPSEKLLAGPRLFERSLQMAMAGLRHRFPDADEATIQKMLEEQLAALRKLESRL